MVGRYDAASEPGRKISRIYADNPEKPEKPGQRNPESAHERLAAARRTKNERQRRYQNAADAEQREKNE
jgi:hypothetical protein